MAAHSKLSKENEKRLAMNTPPNIRWKNLRRAVFQETEKNAKYPFFAMPVSDLMAMEEWTPHQTLLAEGKVRECKEGDDVIFVSHQWLGFNTPDPNGVHYKVICDACEYLLTRDKLAAEELYLWVEYATAGLKPRTSALPPCLVRSTR